MVFVTAALRSNEFVLRGVQGILIERLEHTRKILERQPLSDEDVHVVRKELKRARAGLRLLREALGVNRYRRLNRAVRDAAQPLVSVRDARVMLQTLSKVTEQTGTKASRLPIYNELNLSLQRELDLSRTQLNAEDIAAIRKRLNMVTRKVQGLSDTCLDRAGVETAIKRAHKKARKAFKTVRREPSDENLHEWRKQVKYQYYQLELLPTCKPKRIRPVIQQAHSLGDCLGDDHDLAILHARISTHPEQQETASTGADADALLKPLTAMRSKLQKKARQLGKPLHSKQTLRRVKKSLTA